MQQIYRVFPQTVKPFFREPLRPAEPMPFPGCSAISDYRVMNHPIIVYCHHPCIAYRTDTEPSCLSLCLCVSVVRRPNGLSEPAGKSLTHLRTLARLGILLIH
jgi:hypothetical protein